MSCPSAVITDDALRAALLAAPDGQQIPDPNRGPNHAYTDTCMLEERTGFGAAVAAQHCVKAQGRRGAPAPLALGVKVIQTPLSPLHT